MLTENNQHMTSSPKLYYSYQLIFNFLGLLGACYPFHGPFLLGFPPVY